MKRENTGRILAGLSALLFAAQAAGVQVTAFAEDVILPEETAAPTEAVTETEAPETAEVTVAEPTETVPETTEAMTEETTEAATEAATEAVSEAAETPAEENVTLSDEAAPTAEAADSLIISNPGTIPAEIKEGTAVSISGTVVSANNKAITKVRVEILNAAKTAVYYGEAAPNTTSYDLKNLDSKLLFNKLTAGDYVYHVTATNSAGITTNQDVSFKVVSASSADALTLTGTLTNIPANLKPGTPVTVNGIVKSAQSNITSVTIKLVDANGKEYCPNKVVPNKTEYNLNGLDNIIKFDTLPQGSYTYSVIVSNKTHTNVVLQEVKFTVGTGTVAADGLTLTGATTLPDSMAAGSDYAVKGTLTSGSSNIKSLFVGIYNASGAVVSGRTIAVNAQSYDLKNMDDDVAFNGLGAGSYLFAVIASNSTMTNEVLLTKNFTVTGNAPAVTSDNITISNLTDVPASMKVGTALSIRGTVESETTNLRTLTVAVYDLNGNFKTGGTINPAAKKAELSLLDNYVTFQTLAAGNYHFYVMASNDKNSNQVLAHKQFTVDTNGTAVADTMSITGFTSLPATMTQKTVQNIKGTVTSASSNLTTLFAGVYNSAGQVVTGRTINPASTSCDLAAKLNPYVEFNKLAAGEYTFAVIASNATTTNQVLVNQKFKVTTAASTTTSLSITGGTTVPAAFKQGDTLRVTGTVTSDSVMSSLFVGIYNSAGKVESGRTINPNASTFDLSRLDAYVKFNELTAGVYTYAVIATNATNTNYPIVKQTFTVGNTSSTPSTDKLTLTNGTVIPDTMAVGKAMSIGGTVTSASSNITQLTVGVYKGTEFITGKSINPNAKSYNLANLDKYVLFNTLKDGEYTYAVIASNAAYTNETLYAKKFIVGNGGTTATDTITMTNGTSVPSTLAKGKAVSVKGTITASANITSVTVGIYDASGKAVYSKSVQPNAKTYTISSAIDNALLFNALSAGSYTYRVVVSTANTSNYSLVNQAFTVQ